MRLLGMKPIHWYVLAVSVAGGVLLAAAVVEGDASLAGRSAVFWLFSAFVLLGEALPVRVPRHDEDEEITTSGIFAFSMLLVAGAGPAAVVHAVATLVADLARRKTWWKATFNAAQYVLALMLSGSLLHVMADVPHPDAPPAFRVSELPVILVGAVVFFLVNHVLTRLAIAISQGMALLPSVFTDFTFQASTSLVMLGLSPIVIVTAERSPALVPLLALPMLGAYRSVSIWLEKQYKEHQAMHDPLTTLPNRRLFQDRINQAILGAEREDENVGILIIDLDRFKEVNDTLGHQVGDMLLQDVGPRLQRLLRGSDTIARLGGDEFAVLLPGVVDAAGAVQVADKMLKALEEPFVIDGLALSIEASIGIALYPEHGDDVVSLMQRGDVAMYMAKEAHTGYELYSADRDRHSPKRLALLGELRRAIDSGQFILHYQPMADMRTGNITGMEALVRWNHPRHGLMMPDEFVPLAEHTGLIRPLTLSVLAQALDQCRDWYDGGMELSVAVNLSVRNLQDPDFPEEVAKLLAERNLHPSLLEFEITESAIVVDPIRAMGVLSRLSSMGIGLSLDDFGTGYSSLAYLKRLPVTEIKIDKSFIINMGIDEDDALIVRSTIELARNLGLQVVAEGVENEDAWATLRSFGCDLAQGYYLSRPASAEKMTEWLASSDRVAPPGGAARTLSG
ncbi:MAG TPA: EAL domain-containing protein [Actinomycetota bacterium]|nr:EAL domain-containing protein [Actinomycetota bacterium]